MIEAGESTFRSAVLEASAEKVVLVDFWAPWCGPCRALSPLLEQLEQSYAGRFELVKINSDENPGLAAQFGVRSIPYVIAFLGGEPRDSFVGALPESQLREFLDRVIPDPADLERQKARHHIERGELYTAASVLRAAVALDPTNSESHLDLAELLIERMPAPLDADRLTEAERELDAVGVADRNDRRWNALHMRLSSLREAASLPDIPTLLARVTAEPSDIEARFQLAQQYVAQHQLEPAMTQLLEIVSRNRAFRDDGARRMMLSVFELAADNPQLVSTYRRKLSALLNR